MSQDIDFYFFTVCFDVDSESTKQLCNLVRHGISRTNLKHGSFPLPVRNIARSQPRELHHGLGGF